MSSDNDRKGGKDMKAEGREDRNDEAKRSRRPQHELKAVKVDEGRDRRRRT